MVEFIDPALPMVAITIAIYMVSEFRTINRDRT
jgi:hypothetical protein